MSKWVLKTTTISRRGLVSAAEQVAAASSSRNRISGKDAFHRVPLFARGVTDTEERALIRFVRRSLSNKVVCLAINLSHVRSFRPRTKQPQRRVDRKDKRGKAGAQTKH